jgi:hypothetical protein
MSAWGFSTEHVLGSAAFVQLNLSIYAAVGFGKAESKFYSSILRELCLFNRTQSPGVSYGEYRQANKILT